MATSLLLKFKIHKFKILGSRVILETRVPILHMCSAISLSSRSFLISLRFLP